MTHPLANLHAMGPWLLPLLTLVTVHAPTAQHTRNVAMVLDVSGSMQGDLPRAWWAWRQITEQPTDDSNLAVWCFNGRVTRYPVDWIALPDAEALGKATAWVESHQAEGDTLVIPALRAALKQRRKDLTVVVVTDGHFHGERREQIQAAVAQLQAWREAKGLGRAVIACVGVGSVNERGLSACEDGGGVFRVEVE